MLKQLRLNTLPNSRRSYNRIARAYLAGEINTEKARALGYLMNGILQFWRLESDLEIESRLDQIEDTLREQADQEDNRQ
jgi:hypothetical protein